MSLDVWRRSLLLEIGKLQVSRMVSTLFGALQLLIITRFLTPTEFGLFSLVGAAAALARRVFDSRSSALLIRYYAEFHTAEQRQQRRAIIGLAFVLDVAATLLGALLMALLAVWIASTVLQDAGYQSLVYIGALTLLLGLGSATATGILGVEKAFGLIATAEVVAAVSMFLLVLPIVFFPLDVEYLLLAVGISTFLQTAFRWGYALRQLRLDGLWARDASLRVFFALRSLRPYTAELARFVFATNVLATLKLVKGNLPGLYLGAVLSPAVAGFYLLSQRINERVSAFIEPTQQVLYPHFARLLVARGHKSARRAYVRAVYLNVAIMLPFLLLFGVLGRWSIPFIFGPQYSEALPIIQVALLAFAVGSTFMARTPLLTAASRVRALNVAYFAGIVAQFLVMFWLVPRYGGVGAALGLLAFHVVSVVVTFPALIQVLRPPAQQTDGEQPADTVAAPSQT